MSDKKKQYIKGFIFGVLTALQMILIFRFSSQNAAVSQNTSRGFLHIILEKFFVNMPQGSMEDIIENFDFLVRKGAHFTIYFVLGIFSYMFADSFSPNRRFTFKSGVFICFLYAVSDEIHQYFVPGRACRILDVLIDTLGSVSGILILIFILKLIKIKRKQKIDM